LPYSNGNQVSTGGPGDAKPALTDPDKTALAIACGWDAAGPTLTNDVLGEIGIVPSSFARSVDLYSPCARLAGSVGLAAALLVIGCDGLQTAVANGDTRTLTLHHTHTGEDLTVTFRRNGRYDEEGLKKLNWFLRDWRTDEPTKMDPLLFDIVWEVYREVDGKQPVTIISAYRSPKTNAMLRKRGRGVAEFSQHMLGKAMDFHIPGASLADVRAAGLRAQRGGVGFYPTSGSPFVHLDTGSIRHWPRMTHDQLARVFPDGRTVHVPTDGQPLRNYHLALADVEKRGNRPSQPTLDSARESGTVVAAAGSKRNVLAKLFGLGKHDDDEDERPATLASRQPEPARGAPTKPQMVEASLAPVPMPRARPAQANQVAQAAQPAGGFDLASADSKPVQLPSRTADPSPAEIVNSRVNWSEMSAAARNAPVVAAERAPGAVGQRFVWLTGPAAAPRPPAEIPAAAPPQPEPRVQQADLTASVPRWPGAPANDRVPSDLALAYATTANPESQRPSVLPPEASAAAASSGAAVTQIQRTPAGSRQARPGQRYDDPWLRSIMLAPSVHYSLSVAVYGAPDPRYLRTMMVKPRTSVVSTFGEAPYDAMSSLRFGGPAIAFLRVVNFDSRQASLR
jgi:uncharacterized protein YcbK (DUF882 family)